VWPPAIAESTLGRAVVDHAQPPHLFPPAGDTNLFWVMGGLARLLRVAEGLEYGLVGANDASGYTHEIPFGGV
jgi:hypothetical protein